MSSTITVKCRMRSGYAQTFGRLPGCPTVPGEAAEVELDVRAEKYLRARGDVLFGDDAGEVKPPAETSGDEADGSDDGSSEGEGGGSAPEEKPKRKKRKSAGE